MGDTLYWTMTDEAPALATYAFLPVINRFTNAAGVNVELADISVANRIIALFPECLTKEQQVPDDLGKLGELARTTDKANIVKLPNVSASVPQLNEAIAELQSKGYKLPNYPQDPKTPEEKKINETYGKVLGSTVNPVLREGNSDRRVAGPVKAFAQKNPHKLGAWAKDCRSSVVGMTEGDFYESEQSYICPEAMEVTIEFVPKGKPPVNSITRKAGTQKLKSVKMQKGEVIDSSRMHVAALRQYIEKELQDCFAKDLMVSLHMKATMMKISDPIIFGHVVSVFFKDAFEKHAADLKKCGANPNNGLAQVLDKIKSLPNGKEIEADINACYKTRPRLAMVDSSKGITNLHVPSDVIIDASVPVVVRDSGKMWNKDDKLEDTKCLIPDRCYGPMYNAMFDDCRENGQFDVKTMGNVSNVGLMAQKAEEYGSHPNTFEAKEEGTMRVVNSATGECIFEHELGTGDIWRMCATKDAPIRDWVKLAVSRARATGSQTIFWLNPARSHDTVLIGLVKEYLKAHDTSGLNISIMSPVDACKQSMKNARAGKDSISCTGNVLRDYLTDLFPIIELGTSAKMLSIVPLLQGGGLFETGAGGSAPKHVQQFTKEGHLRWDSLGEYLALAVSLEDYAAKTGSARAALLAKTLSEATSKLLDNNKSPSRKVKEIDNRGSHFYIAMWWAEAMAKEDAEYKKLAEGLKANEAQIVKELIDCQGASCDIGGYWKPDAAKCTKLMRPSAIYNALIDGVELK